MVKKYLKEIIAKILDRAWMKDDEVWLKVVVDKKCLFASIYDQTRYFLAHGITDAKLQHNADRLLKLRKNVGFPYKNT